MLRSNFGRSIIKRANLALNSLNFSEMIFDDCPNGLPISISMELNSSYGQAKAFVDLRSPRGHMLSLTGILK